MVSKKAVKPKVPKGYTDTYTTYELITKTSYSKPYKPPKGRKNIPIKSKEYVQPVKIVSDSSGRKKKKSNTSRKSKRY